MVHPQSLAAPTHPTGTVTFLFTDIEGSTQLWEHHHAWMEQAHAPPRSPAAAAIAAHGGWAYKQIGDAFQAAFQTAPACARRRRGRPARPGQPNRGASRAAAGADGAAHRRGRGARRRLRRPAAQPRRPAAEPPGMAARSCSPPPPPSWCATACRRASPARPGRAAPQGSDPPRADLPGGRATGCPAEFPPLKTLDSRPNNLPRQPTALIGREREVAAGRRACCAGPIRRWSR